MYKPLLTVWEAVHAGSGDDPDLTYVGVGDDPDSTYVGGGEATAPGAGEATAPVADDATAPALWVGCDEVGFTTAASSSSSPS